MKTNRLLTQVMFFTVVALLAIFSTTAVIGQGGNLQPGTAMGRVDAVPIKAEPSNQSATIATLVVGETVHIVEFDGVWAQVEYGDISGWVLSRSLINVRSPLPSPRGYHQMTYDVESNRAILFSGITISNPTNFDIHNDTWVYEIATNTWTLMTYAQAPTEGNGSLDYDYQSDRAILYLGTDWHSPPASNLRETWAYDFNTNTWTNMQPEIAPPELLGGDMVYDAESDRMILFSGLDIANSAAPDRWIFSSETWAYDFDSNTWTKMNPELSPPGRNYHAMAYDEVADRVILFGGVGAADNPMGFASLNDTWAYDYNSDTWTALETSEAPMPRDYLAMVYSEQSQQVILFGGVNEETGQALRDMWSYDFADNSWQELQPATVPGRRGWHAMVYDSAADSIILFGGGATHEHYDLETWIYNVNTNTWTEARH